MKTEYKCPKCSGELSDCWDGEPVSAFIGEWSDDRFRCEGRVVAVGIMGPQRKKSCGYFGLEDLGVEYREDD
ncbi:hypothetical protein [Pasteurella multocida]|uniref:hypothetical protein n=1 Tax=Pasteurella multocida TaxID=747 RepID=UPI0020215926|nr:hypothetical protein [Pasteurella multocida]MCL7785676.1 hypothetical protein [Pasteurella multocida]